MSNAITSAPVQPYVPVAQAQSAQPAARAQATSQTKTQAPSALPQDTVHISAAAQQASQAMKEATETPSQTAQEAGHGDRQAQRLLATEAAEKKL